MNLAHKIAVWGCIFMPKGEFAWAGCNDLAGVHARRCSHAGKALLLVVRLSLLYSWVELRRKNAVACAYPIDLLLDNILQAYRHKAALPLHF